MSGMNVQTRIQKAVDANALTPELATSIIEEAKKLGVSADEVKAAKAALDDFKEFVRPYYGKMYGSQYSLPGAAGYNEFGILPQCVNPNSLREMAAVYQQDGYLQGATRCENYAKIFDQLERITQELEAARGGVGGVIADYIDR